LRSDKQIGSSQAGFTLVETIAAMAILALAAIPLLQLVNNSVRGTGSLEKRFLARTVAENILMEQLSQPIILREEVSIETGSGEQLGRRFEWTLTASAASAGEPQLVTVIVALENNSQTLAQLTGLRLPQLAPIQLPGDSSSLGSERDDGGEAQ